ncbi:nicotinamide-nucleotide amidase [Algoriphagus ratkowskyi]|uniref:CinA-like protein n=1 Tax=Algoriphagus ratkowskyi TaxID=57028 RepID=A0A2W7R3Q3_9BACT|nr:competence/damage-inducible protein A [Algoriphagus ratkowskyi]PZX53846.1 nicotinamide-nucleotide amidase [Algoriphagus ratkowskyi]TXD76749.1 competence/damage-inducible protein A [Algoriphagus ratkowskyi]
MKVVRAEIIAIGDELLYGQIVDTNSHWISQELDLMGVKVVRKTTVGDDRKDILAAFASAEARADIILITGGLGPTQDDLTKPLMAEYFSCAIVENTAAVEAVTEFFRKRGREMTPLNLLQGHLPACCTYVPNEVGTAPGMWFERNGTYWMSMPGVPHEMKKLMTDFVLPKLPTLFPLPVIVHRMIKTVGIGESWLADLIRLWEDALPSTIRLAYLPSLGHVKLRLTGFGTEKTEIENAIQQQIDLVLPSIEKYVYGYDSESLETAIGKLLTESHKTVALAESCSGGYISHLITSISGSSSYFQGAVIPYQNQFKEEIIHVKNHTLTSKGAVSEETVLEMATGVRKLFKADFGLASSGVAGPTGGTEEKPVGTIWIACTGDGFQETKKLQLTQDRMLNIQLTAVAVLNLLRICILEK